MADLSWRFTTMELPMRNTIDCTIRLTKRPGANGQAWPEGATVTIYFYEADETTVLDSYAFSDAGDEFFCKIEIADVATIPEDTYFEIIAVLPDTPTTEAPLYNGTVTKG